MSYQQRVLRDNPVGFWALDKASVSADSSPGIFISGTRTKNNATIGAGAFSSGISPLVCGGDCAISLSGQSTTSNITIPNIYKVFTKTTESKSFTIEFWMSLESISKNTGGAYKLPILYMTDTFSLYFSDNILTLEIANTVKSYLYVEAEDLDPQIHICLSYSNKSYSLSINGNNTSTIQMPESYNFINTVAQNFVFSAFGESTSNKIVIDSISFYNYQLDLTQKADHMIWALSDKNAMAWTITNYGGYIDINDGQGSIQNHTMFSSDEEWALGQFKNCYTKNGALVVKTISDFLNYSINLAPAISLDVTNGLQVTGDSSLSMPNFDKMCNMSSDVISLDIKATAQGSFFSIDGFSFGKLILRYDSSSKIELYSPDNVTISLKTASAVASNTWKSVSIYISNNAQTLNLNVAGEIISCSIPNNSLGKSLDLYLGNSYIIDADGNSISSPLVGGLKNFKVTYPDSTWAKAELLNNYNISQYSEWITRVLPTSTGNIVGSRVHYGSASYNVSYYVSLDNSSWTKITENGTQIPLLNLNAPQSEFYAKVVIETPDSSENTPNVDFLEFVTYRSLYMDSRGFSFNLKPYASNNSKSYTVRPNEFNVLSRDTNIGIYFENSTTPGSGVITPSDTYEAVEFWFKIHTDPTPTNPYYIMDVSGTTVTSLYYDQDLKLNLLGAGWSVGYLNGVAISGTPTLIVDELYHFVGILSTATTQTLILNAKNDYTKGGNTSIGYISLYDSNPYLSVADALLQYNRFLGINQYAQSDSLSLTLTETAKIYSTNWSAIPGAVV